MKTFKYSDARTVSNVASQVGDERRLICRNVGDSFELDVPDDLVDKVKNADPNLLFVQVPKYVTPLQLRSAIRKKNFSATVNKAIASASEEVREAWEYATNIGRNDYFVAHLGIPDGELDDLFRLAVTL